MAFDGPGMSFERAVMQRYSLIVLTNPVEGRDGEYNDWYTNTHLHDVLKIPGIIGAQRFRRSDTQRDAGLTLGDIWQSTNAIRTTCPRSSGN